MKQVYIVRPSPIRDGLFFGTLDTMESKRLKGNFDKYINTSLKEKVVED
jgi:hypothetical protein